MAPPVGTLRVGRYFTALVLLFAVLYAVVAFGSTQKPKLGLDLVGGIRVVFTAQTPQGSPPPTSSQMTQARQILEDRINSTGVTGSTVVVQGSDQLVVEIPSASKADLVNLGKAAVLNFRGLVTSAQAIACVPKGAKASSPTSSSSVTPPATNSSSTPSSGSSASSTTASKAPDAASERPLAASSSSPAVGSSTSAGSATSAPPSASSTPAASPSAAPSATTNPRNPNHRCLADPFTNPKASDAVLGLQKQLISTYKITAKKPLIWDVLPNAETCPSPGLAAASCRAYGKLSSAEQAAITEALTTLDCTSTQTEPDKLEDAYYACDDGKLFGQPMAYLLGHVVVQGKQIDSASAQAPNTSGTGGNLQWTVNLTLTSGGGDKWSSWTSKYNVGDPSGTSTTNYSPTSCGGSTGTPCADFVGFTLDGQVLSSPVTETALDINTSVSGNFTQTSANDLARELNYGKLPVNFRADATDVVSATLGSKQLSAAFLAGGIGLILVVLYSLIYYRALGLVTIASLLVSAGLTYAALVMLGTQLGFTLDLAGIAGFIVALGITADSFVVFFERLKDEVHEGRSARVAVPRAWVRARRTILSADTVSFLAAAILYYFAAADVKGFAFTLGMSTILDLVVVFLFTHPLVSLLSRSASFGSSRMTGLDAIRGTRTPPPDDAPTARERAASRRSGGSPAEDAEPASDRFRGVATMSKPDQPPPAPADLGADEPAAPAVDEVAAAEPVAEDETTDDLAEPERRRTAPEPGSAAERAAARRARMREQRRGQDGDR